MGTSASIEQASFCRAWAGASVFTILWMVAALPSFASTPNTPDERARRQHEQVEQRRNQLEPPSPPTLQADTPALSEVLPPETPCRVLDRFLIDAPPGLRKPLEHSLSGPGAGDPPHGKCLGAQGIELLVRRAHNRLIELGYITSTVHAPEQDLNTGALTLTVTLGRLGKVSWGNETPSSAPWALAFQAGQVLNLRDIEQSLDNLRSVPSADAQLTIAPGDAQGTSDITINYQQPRAWRLSLGLDDAGTRSTGQWRASATVHWDNPTGHSDMFYVSLNPSVAGKEPGPRSNRSTIIHYSVPLGYWHIGLTSSRSHYLQTVMGAFQPYAYKGTSSLDEARLARVMHRNASSISTISIKAFARRSRSIIDDTEVEVQRRHAGGWELGLSQQSYLPQGVLILDWTYRRGTGAFGAQPAPEEAFSEGTSRMRLHQLTASWRQAFKVLSTTWHYIGQLQLQHHQTPLTPQDEFCVGGRYTVRGFDGVESQCSDRGLLWRNEISTSLPLQGWQAYAAADLARLHRSSMNEPSHLAGAAAGLRYAGPWLGGGVHLDVFAGIPLHKPPSFSTKTPTSGVQLSWQY